jgi:hypothetical protein
MDVYAYVCMSGHNSGTPGAISTKLGTHIATCMCKNLMYVLYIFRREDGVGGREFGWFPLLRKLNYYCCQVTVWSIFVAKFVTWWRGIQRCLLLGTAKERRSYYWEYTVEVRDFSRIWYIYDYKIGINKYRANAGEIRVMYRQGA